MNKIHQIQTEASKSWGKHHGWSDTSGKWSPDVFSAGQLYPVQALASGCEPDHMPAPENVCVCYGWIEMKGTPGCRLYTLPTSSNWSWYTGRVLKHHLPLISPMQDDTAEIVLHHLASALPGRFYIDCKTMAPNSSSGSANWEWYQNVPPTLPLSSKYHWQSMILCFDVFFKRDIYFQLLGGHVFVPSVKCTMIYCICCVVKIKMWGA